MAVPFWPPSLPKGYLKDGCEDGIPNETLRNKTDKGYKVRRRSTVMPYILKVDFEFTSEEQWAIFQDFVENTLAGGALAFNWEHCLTGKTELVQLQPESDEVFVMRKRVGTSNKFIASLTFWVYKNANIV